MVIGKKCVVVDDCAGLERAFKLIERASDEFSVILHGPYRELDLNLPRIPIIRIPVEGHRPEDSEEQVEVTRWLNDWSRLPFLGGKNFKELLSYHGISLWWFMEKWIVRSSYFEPLWRAVSVGQQLKQALAAEDPSEVLCICRDSDFELLVRSVCSSMNIKCVSVVHRLRLGGLILKAPVLLSAQVARFLARRAALDLLRILALLFKMGRCVARETGTCVLLILSTDEWGRVFESKSQLPKEGDRLLQGVIDKLSKKYRVGYLVWLPRLRIKLSKYSGKIRACNVEYSVLESWVSFRDVLRAVHIIRQTWQELRSAPGVRGSLCHNGIDFSEMVWRRIDVFLSSVIWEVVVAIRASEAVIQKVNPAAILLTDEVSRAGEALVQTAKQHGVPTIALQHGRMNDIMYWRSPEEVQDARTTSSASHSLADVTCVWGDGHRLLLCGWANYPEDRVVVTGAPHWDFVTNRASTYDKARICADHGINPGRRIIVFLTSTLAWNECEAALRVVCDAVRRLAGAQLVVKLHPGENRAWRYRLLLAKMGVLKVRVTRRADLFELLHISDLILAVMTTSVIEALLMDKPVILVDPQSRGYLGVFDNHPALVSVASADELESCMQRVLMDADVRSRLAAASRDFVHRWCGLVDGKAATRVAQVVEKLAAQHTVPGEIGS